MTEERKLHEMDQLDPQHEVAEDNLDEVSGGASACRAKKTPKFRVGQTVYYMRSVGGIRANKPAKVERVSKKANGGPSLKEFTYDIRLKETGNLLEDIPESKLK
ncbi:MAG: hypothetical protein PUC32_01280 [Oscillospiraceae bacterium]|nr:hypothetical protein [Oscillospiraceae bacterium]